MPELPEVTTIVRELNRAVRGKVIRDVWTDSPKLIRPLSPAAFRRRLRGMRFGRFRRRAKFILAELTRPASGRRADFLLWHMGMTGHPLYRDPKAEVRSRKRRTAMADPMNRHVRLTFHFSDGTCLEYADVRKFGKVEAVRAVDLPYHPQLVKLGPDALELAEDPQMLCERLKTRKKAVKVALLDQEVLAGVGNIYADEVLWKARIHPLLPTRRLTAGHCRALARALYAVLNAAIRAQGTSIDDYRRLSGTKGNYSDFLKAYRQTGLPCSRCGTLIRRLVVGGRGTHVCSRCQR